MCVRSHVQSNLKHKEREKAESVRGSFLIRNHGEKLGKVSNDLFTRKRGHRHKDGVHNNATG